jgi:transcriptional regulator with XRE-family HTH domain
MGVDDRWLPCEAALSMTSQPVSRLRRMREGQGRGLRELAREVELDPGQLSRIERGLEKPSPRVLLRLARALQLRDVERTLREFYPDDPKDSQKNGHPRSRRQ